LLALIWFLISPMAGRAAGTQVVRGSVPAATARLAPIDDLDLAKSLHVAISLPIRNQQTLTDLVSDVSNPASPNYRHYLSVAQFTERFGPTQADYDAVASFAAALGLTVSQRYANRAGLDVTGAVSNLQKTFHVTVRRYRHPTEKREFYAPDAAPSVDLAVPISRISGLDNYYIPKPKIRPMPAGLAQRVMPHTGSAPDSVSYGGGDFRAAYAPGESGSISSSLWPCGRSITAPFGYRPHLEFRTVPGRGVGVCRGSAERM
jgi:subtilase family serine protease